MHKVFVYGSLLSGMGNHRLLSESKILGMSSSPSNFAMVDLGYFPGVLIDELHPGKVVGEVYEVDDETLADLDRLEGYNPHDTKNSFYNRIEIDTDFGKAFIYIYTNRYGRSLDFVKDGDWKTYFKAKIGDYDY